MATKSNIFYTSGTCSQAILTEIEGDTIVRVQFVGGCSGNTQGVAALVAGMKISDAIQKLKGIDCAGRGTSCPDQLAKAFEKISNEK